MGKSTQIQCLQLLLYVSWNFAKQHYFEDKRHWEKSYFGSITSYVRAGEGGSRIGDWRKSESR